VKGALAVPSQILSAIVAEFWHYELSGIRQPFAEFLRILEKPGATNQLGQVSMVDFPFEITLAF